MKAIRGIKRIFICASWAAGMMALPQTALSYNLPVAPTPPPGHPEWMYPPVRFSTTGVPAVSPTKPQVNSNGLFRPFGGGSGIGGAYSPSDIRNAYVISPILSRTGGEGQTIVIVDAYGSPTLQDDLNSFNAQYGLPTATVTIQNPYQGMPSKCSSSQDQAAWAEETSLDVEWAHAIAPNANIVLLQVPDSCYLINGLFYSLYRDVNFSLSPSSTPPTPNPLGNIVSMSFGSAEANLYSFLSNYGLSPAQVDHLLTIPGISLVASSGDSGQGVNFPCVSSAVTCVGGTSLTYDPTNGSFFETNWNGGGAGGAGGSGGGISQMISIPDFQHTPFVPPYSTTFRLVPDVALIAGYNEDVSPTPGVSVALGGYFYSVGGTSVGAPQWAALYALVNAVRSSFPLNSGGVSTNAWIYSAGLDSQSFRDVTSGCDVIDPSPPYGCAKTGFDTVTGFGSPVGSTLFNFLTNSKLNVSLGGNGNGSVNSSNVSPPITCTRNGGPGLSCSASYLPGTTVTLSASANPGTTFTGWSGGGCSGTGTCTTTLKSPYQTVTANFMPDSLIVTVNGSGSGTVTSSGASPTFSCTGGTCGANYPPGSRITLTASVADDSTTFTGWSGGGCSGTAPTCIITTTNSSIEVSATFTRITYPVALSVVGTGQGTVFGSTLACSIGNSGNCTTTVIKGTQVTLTAAPAPSTDFTVWTSGPCYGSTSRSCSFPVNGPISASAQFTLVTFPLGLWVGGSGSGSVTTVGAFPALNCSVGNAGACWEVYPRGSIVTLAANRGGNSNFITWGGGCTGNAPTCTVTMNGPVGVGALFNVIQYPLFVSVRGRGNVSTAAGVVPPLSCGGGLCGQNYNIGTQVVLVATPDRRKRFLRWYGGGCRPKARVCVIPMYGPQSVTAIFSR